MLLPGKVVTVVGPPAQGKATILRLLSGQIFPTVVVDPENPVNGRCTLFVPPHLRIVQIQENPMIFNTTVFANLVYGIKPSPNLDWTAIKKRSLKIAKRLRMSVELTNYHFEDEGFLGIGGVRITRADRQLISLARALVMNPELIVAHKPTSLLDDRQTDNVLDMFKEFTENRGVFMPAIEPLVRRRRRTIIFSAKNEYVASHADVVYQARKGVLLPIPRGRTEAENMHALKMAFRSIKQDTAKLLSRSPSEFTDDYDENAHDMDGSDEGDDDDDDVASRSIIRNELLPRPSNVDTKNRKGSIDKIPTDARSLSRSSTDFIELDTIESCVEGSKKNASDINDRGPSENKKRHKSAKRPGPGPATRPARNKTSKPVRGWGSRTSSRSQALSTL